MSNDDNMEIQFVQYSNGEKFDIYIGPNKLRRQKCKTFLMQW